MVKGPLKTRRSRVFTQLGPIAAFQPKLTRTLLKRKQVQFGSALAALCPAVERPGADDYDGWQAWAIELPRRYATSAARHAKTVQA
jgi:hypothetical protein